MDLSSIQNKIPEQLYKVLEKEKITKLRPCQEKAIKAGLLDRKNLLVCTPTASGKTLIAELAALKSIIERKGKAIYIVPLKALANEKYKDFKKKYSHLCNIALSIGDLDKKETYLTNYDFTICTSEKLDSLIRHHAPWLQYVSTVIIDEIHLLDSIERGPTLEILITILRRLLQNVQIIGLSACVHGSELIYLTNGEILPIRDIVEEEFRRNKPNKDKNNSCLQYVYPTKPISILGLDKNLHIRDLKVEKLWKIKNNLPLIKIETAKGKQLTLTINSKLLTLKSRSLQWVDAINLNKNDHIVTAQRISYPDFKKIRLLELLKGNSSIYILNVNYLFRKLVRKFNPNLDLHQLASHYNLPYSTFYHYWRDRTIPLNLLVKLSERANIDILEHISKILKLGGKSIKIPKTINHDFLRFLGMIAGDGYIRKQICFNKRDIFTYTIKFSNKEESLNTEYKRLLLELFDIKPYCTHERGYPITIFSSRLIGDLLIKCGLISGKKASSIKLSPIICSLGNKEINGFISGLFDCDGNVYLKKNKTGYIRYYSTSYFIIKQLQLLLLRFNIMSSVTIAHSNRENKVYKLTIADKDSLTNFKNQIGFKSKKKQSLLQKIEFKTCSRKNLIPNLCNLLRRIRIKVGFKITSLKNYYEYEKRRDSIPKKTLCKFVTLLGKNKDIKKIEEFSLLKKIAFSEISFEKIKKKTFIKNEENYVYDFTVKNSNYLASGIITHNTIGNPTELAEWLNANLVIDDWRPVELKQGIYYKNKVEFY